MIKTFILYVLITGAQCSPQWVANGEFFSKQACQDASRQIGAQNNPSNFKCIKR